MLSPDEQLALLRACRRRPKLAALVELLLITGARVGELLDLRWTEDHGDELHFLNTKNGRVRQVQVTARMRELLDVLPRRGSHVFTNARTGKPYQNIRKVFGAGAGAGRDHDRRRHPAHLAAHRHHADAGGRL